MLAYTFYEGDNRVMRYAEALAERGDQVEVIALRQPQHPRHYVSNRVAVTCIQKRVKNERRQLSYILRILTFFFRAAVTISLRHLRRPYDMIHVHSVPDFLVFAAWLPRIMGATIILDVHDISPELYTSKFDIQPESLLFRILCRVERASASFAKHVILPNHIWLRKLAARSVVESKCSVFMNLPDLSIFRPARQRAIQRDRFLILYPGSLQWHQGLDIAIRAIGMLAEAGWNIKFHIYGDGQARQSLMQLTHELQLDGRVFFHAPTSLREVGRIMADADLGVIPKRSNSFGNEAFSTKILEFMASRVPVITSDTSIDKLYFNDDVVTFFSSGSADSLAEQMLNMLLHPDKRTRQALLAEKFVMDQYNWNDKKHDYLRLVDELVSGNQVEGTRGLKASSRVAARF